MRIVAITGGKLIPSRRFRINSLAPFLARKNIELFELCPTISMYPPSVRLLRFPWFVAALAERLTFLYRSCGFDAVILQRELISTLATFEGLLPEPRIFDIDDAIYLYRNGIAAKRIARSCSLVVCGNNYLAEKFSQWNPNVIVIPTGIDIDQLRPIANRNISEFSVIGWIGTAGNYCYLKMIEPALKRVLSYFPTARLQIISNQYPKFLEHIGGQLDFRLWRPGIENDLIPRFTMGIMPLADNEWARGKCAFKMLQYMAAGVPVVATPVGMNAEIFSSASIGLAAQSNKQWIYSISTLLQSPATVERLGMNGRELVEKKYSLSAVSLKWQYALRRLVRK